METVDCGRLPFFFQSVSNLWVPARYNVSDMVEQPILESFIVRIYRIDTGNPETVTGVLESIDGSRERKPFVSLGELGSLLCRQAGKLGQRGRKPPAGSL